MMNKSSTSKQGLIDNSEESDQKFLALGFLVGLIFTEMIMFFI